MSLLSALRLWRAPIVALALAVAPVPATAGGLPDTLVEAEVLPGWQTADGTRMTALRLTLAPGWKTYWRAPGDAGIPPRFDWRGSDNLGAVRLHWPRPEVFMDYGMRTVGYSDELVLPIELIPRSDGEPIRVKAEMELGVCESVCVPATLTFDALLSGSGASDPAIHAALAERPRPAARAGVKRVTCRMEPTSDGLRLTAEIAMPKMGDSEVVMVEPGDPRIWVSDPSTRREGRTLAVSAELVPPRGEALAIDRSALRFTVLGKGQAVDIRGCAAG